jgi:hypothetical protein
MDILTDAPSDTGPHLHKQAQRLRWLQQAYACQQRVTEAQTGIRYRTDLRGLAAAFADWLTEFEAQKPADSASNAAYVGFAAGLMLRALIRHDPSKAAPGEGATAAPEPARFWPEGYLYVSFCLGVRGQVLQEDYGARQCPSSRLGDLRTWWSFRENIAEDPSCAIGFLDLFAGEEPDWQTPQLFRDRRRWSAGVGLAAPTGSGAQ